MNIIESKVSFELGQIDCFPSLSEGLFTDYGSLQLNRRSAQLYPFYSSGVFPGSLISTVLIKGRTVKPITALNRHPSDNL